MEAQLQAEMEVEEAQQLPLEVLQSLEVSRLLAEITTQSVKYKMLRHLYIKI